MDSVIIMVILGGAKPNITTIKPIYTLGNSRSQGETLIDKRYAQSLTILDFLLYHNSKEIITKSKTIHFFPKEIPHKGVLPRLRISPHQGTLVG